MRVLVDCCNYFLDNDNLGDRAVFAAVVERIAGAAPDAVVEWVTLDRPLIRRTCPTAVPLVLAQRGHCDLFEHGSPPAPGVRSKFWGGTSDEVVGHIVARRRP